MLPYPQTEKCLADCASLCVDTVCLAKLNAQEGVSSVYMLAREFLPAF